MTKIDNEIMINIAQGYLIKANTSIKDIEIKECILKANHILNKLAEQYDDSIKEVKD